jgi:ribosomal protein S18 acetylase RimI-like enzyme
MFIYERPLPKFEDRVLQVSTYNPGNQSERAAVDALILQGVGEMRPEDTAESRQEMVRAAPTNILVAMIDDEVVGVTYLMHCGIWAHLWHFIVSDAYQGKGIGSTFLSIVMAYLRRQGMLRASFVVRNTAGASDFSSRDTSEAAIRMFMKAGFEFADNYTLMWHIKSKNPPSP